MAQRPTRYHALPANESEQLLARDTRSVGRTDLRPLADPVEEQGPEPEPEPEPESPEPRGPEWPALLTPSMTSMSSPDPARRGPGAMELPLAGAQQEIGISPAKREVPNRAYVHSVYAYSPRWEERRRHPTMYAKQCKEEEKAKAKAARAAKEAVDTARKHTGPLAERISDSQKLRYGEIFFEETGNVVPYIIAPEGVKEDGARKKAAVKLLAAMVKNMTKGDNKKLSKPNITLQLQGHGTHYLEWAKETYENDALSEAWGWCPNEDTAAMKIQACARGRKSRRAFRFLVETCERALMALVIEGTPRAGGRNAKGTDNLVDAAEGVTRKPIRPIDTRVSSIEWRFEGGELKHHQSAGAWSKGSAKKALAVLSKASNSTDPQQQPVALRWYVNGKLDSASASVTLAVSDAVIVLRHVGKTITSLKEVAANELQLDSKLVAYYASPTPAIFRAAREERTHILQSLIETLHREPRATASRGQQLLSEAQQDCAKGLTKFPRTSDNGAGMTLEAFSQKLGCESVINLLNGKAPNKRVAPTHKTDQGKNVTFKRERTETLRTRAERLGCDLDVLEEEAPGRRHEKHLRLITKLRALIDSNSDSAHSGSAYSEEILHFYKSLDDHLGKHEGRLAEERPSTLASDLDRLLHWWAVMDSAARRATQELYRVAHQLTVYTDRYTDSHCTQIDLVDAIVAQSQEAIERRKQRREARLKDDKNADIDFRVAEPKSNTTQLKYAHLEEQLEDVQAYFKRRMKEPDASDLHDEARDSIQKAALILKELLLIQSNKDLTDEVMRAIQPDSEDSRRELKRSISTAFSAGAKKTSDAERSPSPAADETANGTPRLGDLVLRSSWEEGFRDMLREHPTLGAKLGMPLDLDKNTVPRMVFDIQQNVHLDPDEFPCPLLAIAAKIKKLGSSHSQYEQLCAMSKEAEKDLDAYGIGPTSPHLSAEIRQQFWGDIIGKHGQKWDQFRKRWGVTTVWGYLDWLRDHTVDLQKVRAYFLCAHSKGACRAVEDELRKELEQLPFVPLDADSDEPRKQEGSTRGIPLDRAMIEYGDRMISMVSNIVAAVINSDGWLFFPADRGPVSQLIGETIERLAGPKHEVCLTTTESLATHFLIQIQQVLVRNSCKILCGCSAYSVQCGSITYIDICIPILHTNRAYTYIHYTVQVCSPAQPKAGRCCQPSEICPAASRRFGRAER